MFCEQLKKQFDFQKSGDFDDNSGSDTAPSEDNLEAKKLVEKLPAVDQTLTIALKKANAVLPPKVVVQPCMKKKVEIIIQKTEKKT